jgi:septal ring factor EnvC (AmiA/AmiB activator)
MSNAKIGSSYDDKFSGMELGKLRATVAEQAKEIERLTADVKLEADGRDKLNEENKRLTAALKLAEEQVEQHVLYYSELEKTNADLQDRVKEQEGGDG